MCRQLQEKKAVSEGVASDFKLAAHLTVYWFS